MARPTRARAEGEGAALLRPGVAESDGDAGARGATRGRVALASVASLLALAALARSGGSMSSSVMATLGAGAHHRHARRDAHEAKHPAEANHDVREVKRGSSTRGSSTRGPSTLGLANHASRRGSRRSLDRSRERDASRPAPNLHPRARLGDDEDSLAALREVKERFRRSATASGFIIPVTPEEAAESPWLNAPDRPSDLFLENILADGADALPDVTPDVPFDPEDPEYDTPDWFHAPLLGRGYPGGRNKFKLCIDHADDWDIAFPEGWFQTMVEGTLRPGYCIGEVVEDRQGSGCGDADVVLFNEGALIWKGAHMDGESGGYRLPPKHHPEVVYVYFAHEAPAGFGSELMDRRMMEQFDYLAYSNEHGSTMWWNFMPSARHLVQDYDAFARPFSERAPVLGWLAIDCGGHPREGILTEISKHFPVYSIGSCRNNRQARSDLPGRDTHTDEQRRRMQSALSEYLFYFSAENSDCPGYTTEKLWMALTRGSVPVYFGDDDVHRHLPCDECVLDVKKFPTAEALAERMRAIASDENEYRRITAWRRADPRTWPEAFRRGVAVASADVTRLTCGVLRNGPGNRPRSTVQIAKTGGYVERVADSNSGSGPLSSGPEEPGPEEPSTFDPYAVDGRSHATIRDADAAYREEKSPDSGLVRRLQALACETGGTDQDADGDSGRLGYATPRDEPNANARGGALVFGRSTRSYAECEETLTPPEVHLDVSCDDARRDCFAFKAA